jgi:hypothetical protein
MIFLTSGALGLAPVRQVFDEAGLLIADTTTMDHPVFRRLSERFHALVGG